MLTSKSELTRSSPVFRGIFATILLGGLVYIGYALWGDVGNLPGLQATSMGLLGLALVVALGFEFANGFHDTANAVATVIYTNTLPPQVAVIWSGFFNFLGVMFASGAVAYSIIALLPVELILNVGTSAGFAMVFALLIAAILWNLGTWFLGIPASSSHTLIGSIMGVGLMNQLLMSGGFNAHGVDWSQVIKVGKALIFSPLVGFFLAGLVVFLARLILLKYRPHLFDAPEGDEPPRLPTRLLLILTCTGVSFAHGSNDGQKGMGLIMLILVGIVPLAYSLNPGQSPAELSHFVQTTRQVALALTPSSTATNTVLSAAEATPQPDQPESQSATETADLTVNQPGNTGVATIPSVAAARQEITRFLSHGDSTALTQPALASLATKTADTLATVNDVHQLTEGQVRDLRNDMYLSGTALKKMEKDKVLADMLPVEQSLLQDYRKGLEKATQYIPDWVKVAVALALGMGTMVGWRRIVTTVGEKIGKHHMTYAQGASAELVAMSTILFADKIGMPVSTTQVLSSAVAGTMVANKSGLQKRTIQTILTAWLLTLPVCIVLSGGLYWLFLTFLSF